MSVEGQDDSALIAAWKAGPGDYMTQSGAFKAGWRAHRVEAEARERERQAKLDGLAEMVTRFERERAVLVEALKKIAAYNGKVPKPKEHAKIARAALAEVVEAEPARCASVSREGDQCQRRAGHDGRHEHDHGRLTGDSRSMIDSWPVEAEPDGRTDGD